MKKLPVIVGFGGINAAGRTSMHHGHKRMVHEALSEQKMQSTWQDLATLMQLDINDAATKDAILAGTLVRRIEKTHYDVDAVPTGKQAKLAKAEAMQFQIKKIHMPQTLPENWKIISEQGREVTVEVTDALDVILPDSYASKVTSAGQLPAGFDPGALYKSAHHPRGLQMTVYGASDAVESIGIDWQTILSNISPEQISVYAGSAVGQADQFGLRGLYQAGYNGKRTTSKMMPLALPEMAADFVNSYIINSVGNTGSNAGACATFLYNLRQGLIDIQAGHCRVAIVGNAEAPINPEIIEGFRVMGALAEDDQLNALDGVEQVDNTRACRPFSANAGFTMAESAQFMVLMDDELAMQLGATVFGSVADVFVNADANKKSISGPGVGNYVTMARTTALAKAILQDDVNKTFVMAHGTGTPQNRVTESHILNEVAKTFEIDNWAVSAIKSYLGHSLGPAAGDQITAALGVWHTGVIPGIKTIDHIADDVETSNLSILMDHQQVGDYGQQMMGAVINSKGFGGNNASALILSPEKTRELMEQRFGKHQMTQYLQLNEPVVEKQAEFDAKACTKGIDAIYSFGTAVMTDQDIEMTQSRLKLSEFSNSISLPATNPYLK
ncbi:beta-ketoacyl synthase [Reinekea marinisedimentorum]|uniref:Acetoacetyl-[acyl-carrier protein] synthase n=1 Tax=Reinekea marinisedimentorum TaxID=230495 RepID=A0A4V2UK40_9GAMM|nr:beta-ketoacyl synthase [Reinekea marinisedimentorum]TCS42646.1 acetoacetyl-[acyl-carrier protein] synthase [Reinekea marinisedimentorum]